MKQKEHKKMSYLSIIVLVMAGTIGAGIFFKNKTLSAMAQGHFGIVIATWGVGIFGMLMLALALVEVTSPQKSNRGTLE
jgi:amino acid transporter